MTISEIIKPGDKVDARLVQQIESAEKTGTATDTYKSQVLDMAENGNIIISMPTENGRLILLPLGVRFEFVFYSAGSLYRSVGRVVERYKRDNIFMLEIELKSQLEKFQRREYYRYECSMNFQYYILDENQKELDSLDSMVENLLEEPHLEQRRNAVAVDISGGGMKFRSEEKLNPKDEILVAIRLTNDRMDRQFYIKSEIIACVEIKTTKDRLYESRIKFLINDNKVREDIIRYIFEEERKTRKKVNG